MKKRRLTQDHVAARAGTSQSMVSRVIARDRRVPELMAERVWAAVEALFAEYPPVEIKPREGAA
jgi:DNA-binding LacI/PurR family transcriptional regulator